MSTSQHDVLEGLFAVKEIAKLTARSCEDTKCKLFTAAESDLKNLDQASIDLSIVIYRPQFKSLPHVDTILAKAGQLAEQAKRDIQSLSGTVSTFGHIKRESGRSRAERVVNQNEIQESRSRIRALTRSFNRLQDVIEGREDWTRLSPKEPPRQTPVSEVRKSSKGSPNLAPLVVPTVSISAPPSPFQPSVEDVEDDPDDEPRNVTNYHYVHPDDTSSGADKAKGRAYPTPPQVLVRAPTEPLSEDDLPKSDDKKEQKQHLKSAMKKPPSSSSNNTPKTSPTEKPAVPGAPRIDTSTSDKSLEEAQRKAAMLEAELEEIRSPDESPLPGLRTPRTQAHHQSMDFGYGSLHPEQQQQSSSSKSRGRQRAHTATGMERPPQYLSTSSESENVKRTTPRHSPRERLREHPDSGISLRASPRYSSRQYDRSPRLSQQDFGDYDTYDDPSRYHSSRHHAADGRTSLPSHLDAGHLGGHNFPHRGQPGPVRYSPRGHHLDRDKDYDDFFRAGEGKAGDFELFADNAAHRDTHSGHRTSPQSHSPTSHEEWKPVIEHELPVSLENMFAGTTLTAQIHRHVPDPIHGGLMSESHSVHIPIGRGLKPGSRIKFRGHGDIVPEHGEQDIHFIVREAPHPIFQLKDRDVYATLELPLATALLGWERNIRTICGKTVRIAHEGPTPPNWQKDFAGLGMCSRRDNNVRGDMIISVKIVWPKPGSLSEKQKELLRRALLPSTPREERAGGIGLY